MFIGDMTPTNTRDYVHRFHITDERTGAQRTRPHGSIYSLVNQRIYGVQGPGHVCPPNGSRQLVEGGWRGLCELVTWSIEARRGNVNDGDNRHILYMRAVKRSRRGVQFGWRPRVEWRGWGLAGAECGGGWATGD
jgi:hypothetical protein